MITNVEMFSSEKKNNTLQLFCNENILQIVAETWGGSLWVKHQFNNNIKNEYPLMVSFDKVKIKIDTELAIKLTKYHDDNAPKRIEKYLHSLVTTHKNSTVISRKWDELLKQIIDNDQLNIFDDFPRPLFDDHLSIHTALQALIYSQKFSYYAYFYWRETLKQICIKNGGDVTNNKSSIYTFDWIWKSINIIP